MSETRKPGRTFFQGKRRLAVALTLVLAGGQANALSPEHEVRRLMLATETAVENGSWGEAGDYLNRLQNLDAEKPADYLYFRGRVMYEAGHLNEARQALEQYVSTSGDGGEHYDEALELITSVEKAQKNASVLPEPAQQNRVAIIEPAGEQSLESLRRLYLTNSDAAALEAHLNSLLALNGWREDHRLVRASTPADVEYKVFSGQGEVHIQESRNTLSGQRQVSTEVLSVYGISPQVRWDCDAGLDACWIYDPRDGSRLMQLGADRDQASEAARTLGRLIKVLQKPS